MEKVIISMSMLRDIIGEGDLHILLSENVLKERGLDLSIYEVYDDYEYLKYIESNLKK